MLQDQAQSFTEVVRGFRNSEAKKAKTYSSRVCEQCGTRLSRYNRKAQCFAHWPREFPRTHGKTAR